METETGLYFTDPIFVTIALCIFVVVLMVIFTLQKLTLIVNLKKDLQSQHQTIMELDDQSKLIIKSDMELKLYQQEIEDKLIKLTQIKELIISSVHILNKEELFGLLNEKVINSLGFKKGLLLDFNSFETLFSHGLDQLEIQTIINIFKYKKEIFKGVQLLPHNTEIFQQLTKNLHTRDVLAAPIKVRENIYALLLVCDLTLPTGIKKSEEEAFLIVCMHFSQCLDKIRLFEGLYHTKDNLEKKIKERTNELVKSLRAIEEISKAKSDFISSVSHELRTPLTSVKGFSSLLVEEKFGKLPAEAKKRLIKVDENVNRLMVIVNTLLDIARIESGKFEVKIAPGEISKLIKEVCYFLTPQIEEKKIHLSTETPANLNVYMDKSLIERVLINLINNAIKFTPSGGRIRVSCKQNANQATIAISDTGCGIQHDDLEKIFQEFYRVSNLENAKIKGTGLGLSLVKRIIDTHKEKIWAESHIGAGTTFFFTLRVVKNA